MKNYVTTSDLATEFGVSPASIRAWVRMGSIKAIRLGRRHLIPMAELERIRTDGIPLTGGDGETGGAAKGGNDA